MTVTKGHLRKPTTRSKGDEFEKLVYRRFKRAFAKGKFGITGAHAKYRKKPKYYSRDRNGKIEFDMSVELRAEVDEAPVVTVIIECKDYGKTVPVDDVEEFKAKLDQCFGKNVKGILVSSAPFQAGALTYAQSNGICLVRILGDSNLSIIAFYMGDAAPADVAKEFKDEARQNTVTALTDSAFHGNVSEVGDFDFYAWFRGRAFVQTDDLVSAIVASASPRPKT